MAVDWVAIGEGGALLTAVFGFGIVQGRIREKVKDLAKRVEAHDKTITDHSGRLAEGEGNFKVIETKLDYISKAVDSMVLKLDNHISGSRD